MDALEFDDLVDTRIAVEELVIRDANDMPTPLKIRVLSRDSDAWRKQVYKLQTENAKFSRKGKDVPLEKSDADGIALITAVTVSWEGINRDGQPMPCTPENVAKLYEKAPWIADQVFAFVRERENFMRS